LLLKPKLCQGSTDFCVMDSQEEKGYRDIKGFCKSATLAEIEKHNFVLTPGRYVGIPDEIESEISFEETMSALTTELAAQMQEATSLDEEIKIQLAKVGFSLEGLS
jgi:type I restriction enzyme M protein